MTEVTVFLLTSEEVTSAKVLPLSNVPQIGSGQASTGNQVCPTPMPLVFLIATLY